MYKIHFSCALASVSLPTASTFSRSGLRGTQGGRVYTTAQVGPRPSSMARAHGVKVARAGFFSRDCVARCRAAQDRGNVTISLLLLNDTVLAALKLSTLRQSRYNSSRTPSSSLRDGHGRCFCVCACVCVPCFLSSYEDIMSRAGQLIGFRAGEQDDFNPHFLGILKATSQARYTIQRQPPAAAQQHLRLKLWSL